MWTAFSGSCPMAQHIFLSWPKPRTWFCVHKVLLPSIPLQSVETPVMDFLFPCLTLPYVSYAEVPNDITKITLCAGIFGAQSEAPVTGVPSGGLCCWWIDPSCSQAALTGSHQYMSYIWVTMPSACCAALPFPPPTASILKHHWTSHQGCASSWQPHFLGCFQCVCAAGTGGALLPQPERGRAALGRAERLWDLRQRSAWAPAHNPEPPRTLAWLSLSSAVSFQWCSHQSSHQCPTAPCVCCRMLCSPCRTPPVPCWQHLCLSGRGFARAMVSSSSAASLGSPPAMSTPGSEPLLVLAWLGFQNGPSLPLPPPQANHALLAETVCSKALFLALSETS